MPIFDMSNPFAVLASDESSVQNESAQNDASGGCDVLTPNIKAASGSNPAATEEKTPLHRRTNVFRTPAAVLVPPRAEHERDFYFRKLRDIETAREELAAPSGVLSREALRYAGRSRKFCASGDKNPVRYGS